METNNVDSNAVNSDNVITERRMLYMAALKGDWESIEDMRRIQRRISKRPMMKTTLHIAAAANKEGFVKKLLIWMRNNPTTLEAENVPEIVIGSTVRAENVPEIVNWTNPIAENVPEIVIGTNPTAENVPEIVTVTPPTVENVIGTTSTAGDEIGNPALNLAGTTPTADEEIWNSALTLAATVGNVNIAEEIIKELNIANKTPMKALFLASFSGHSQMVQFLYPTTNFVGDGKAKIFINCVKNDLYGEALQMLNNHPDLARARNHIKTALHVLAHKPSAFVSASQPGMLRKYINNLCELF